MIASICLLAGIAIGTCLTSVYRAYREPNAPRALEAVNLFHGVVFPAPHDPRWRFAGRWAFPCGSVEIILTPSGILFVGTTEIEREADDYLAAVVKAQASLERLFALTRVESAIHSERLKLKHLSD